MSKILVTGSSGYLGKSIIESSYFEPLNVYETSRRVECAKKIIHLDLDNLKNFKCPKVETIIHCAGIAHKVKHKNFKKINYEATIELAKIASKNNVKNFIFISSIGVCGKSSDSVINESSKVSPEDPYSESKYLAENALFKLSKNTKMKVIILRPSLIYGKGAPGNYSSILKLIKSGFTLPFLSIKNSRNFCSIHNIVSFLYILCRDANEIKSNYEVFNICDDAPMSTLEFVQEVSRIEKKIVNNFYFPISFLKIFLILIGKGIVIKSIFNNHLISNEKAKTLTLWKPTN